MDERIQTLARVRRQLDWRLKEAKKLCELAEWDEERALEMAPTYDELVAEAEATARATEVAEAEATAHAFTSAAVILKGHKGSSSTEAMTDIVIPHLEREAKLWARIAQKAK